MGTPERSLPDSCSRVTLLVCLTCGNVVHGHSALERVARPAPLWDWASSRATESAYPTMLGANLGGEAASREEGRSAGWDNRSAESKVERALTSEQFGPWMEPHTCIHRMPIPERLLEITTGAALPPLRSLRSLRVAVEAGSTRIYGHLSCCGASSRPAMRIQEECRLYWFRSTISNSMLLDNKEGDSADVERMEREDGEHVFLTYRGSVLGCSLGGDGRLEWRFVRDGMRVVAESVGERSPVSPNVRRGLTVVVEATVPTSKTRHRRGTGYGPGSQAVSPQRHIQG